MQLRYTHALGVALILFAANVLLSPQSRRADHEQDSSLLPQYVAVVGASSRLWEHSQGESPRVIHMAHRLGLALNRSAAAAVPVGHLLERRHHRRALELFRDRWQMHLARVPWSGGPVGGSRSYAQIVLGTARGGNMNMRHEGNQMRVRKRPRMGQGEGEVRGDWSNGLLEVYTETGNVRALRLWGAHWEHVVQRALAHSRMGVFADVSLDTVLDQVTAALHGIAFLARHAGSRFPQLVTGVQVTGMAAFVGAYADSVVERMPDGSDPLAAAAALTLVMSSIALPMFRHAALWETSARRLLEQMVGAGTTTDAHESLPRAAASLGLLASVVGLYGAELPHWVHAMQDSAHRRMWYLVSVLPPQLADLPLAVTPDTVYALINATLTSALVHLPDAFVSTVMRLGSLPPKQTLPLQKQRVSAASAGGTTVTGAPAYTSVGFPAAAYFIMRSGWTSSDTHLLFAAGRFPLHHIRSDADICANALELTALGRSLLRWPGCGSVIRDGCTAPNSLLIDVLQAPVADTARAQSPEHATAASYAVDSGLPLGRRHLLDPVSPLSSDERPRSRKRPVAAESVSRVQAVSSVTQAALRVRHLHQYGSRPDVDKQLSVATSPSPAEDALVLDVDQDASADQVAVPPASALVGHNAYAESRTIELPLQVDARLVDSLFPAVQDAEIKESDEVPPVAPALTEPGRETSAKRSRSGAERLWPQSRVDDGSVASAEHVPASVSASPPPVGPSGGYSPIQTASMHESSPQPGKGDLGAPHAQIEPIASDSQHGNGGSAGGAQATETDEGHQGLQEGSSQGLGGGSRTSGGAGRASRWYTSSMFDVVDAEHLHFVGDPDPVQLAHILHIRSIVFVRPLGLFIVVDAIRPGPEAEADALGSHAQHRYVQVWNLGVAFGAKDVVIDAAEHRVFTNATRAPNVALLHFGAHEIEYSAQEVARTEHTADAGPEVKADPHQWSVQLRARFRVQVGRSCVLGTLIQPVASGEAFLEGVADTSKARSDAERDEEVAQMSAVLSDGTIIHVAASAVSRTLSADQVHLNGTILVLVTRLSGEVHGVVIGGSTDMEKDSTSVNRFYTDSDSYEFSLVDGHINILGPIHAPTAFAWASSDAGPIPCYTTA